MWSRGCDPLHCDNMRSLAVDMVNGYDYLCKKTDACRENIRRAKLYGTKSVKSSTCLLKAARDQSTVSIKGRTECNPVSHTEKLSALLSI